MLGHRPNNFCPEANWYSRAIVLTVDLVGGLRGLVIALLSYVVSRGRCCRRYSATGRSHLTKIIFTDFFCRLHRLWLLISARRSAGGFWETYWRAQPQADSMIKCMRVCTLAV
jgi:hypothetical protein